MHHANFFLNDVQEFLARYGYMKTAEKDDLLASGELKMIQQLQRNIPPLPPPLPDQEGNSVMDNQQKIPPLPPPLPNIMSKAISMYQNFSSLEVTGQ